MFIRKAVSFMSNEVQLKGWFYKPKVIAKTLPCIVMTHGFTALKEHGLDKFAAYFASHGLTTLVYDNRGFGDSGGSPRLEANPLTQIEDYKHAITFAQSLPEVNPDCIGIWGTSYSGGHVLVAAAQDKRVQCVVSQVPFIEGHHRYLQENRPDKWTALQKAYKADEAARADGSAPQEMQVVTNNPEQESAVMKQPHAFRFFTGCHKWQNRVTFQSLRYSGDYYPGETISQVAPTPLLMIVAKDDTVNPAAPALKAFDCAGAPKKLVTITGDHFAPYSEQFDVCAPAACEWFEKTFVTLDCQEEVTQTKNLQSRL